ncbi:hypothetical protein SAMN05216338_1003128 [Bradyrhizobium sp. Rc2d]|nr:hypothetical protein SAMN05216338_1003128 [Bradyrhizobium sp. Rc2d]
MRPKKHRTRGSGDLFRARLDQIINMKHALLQLAGKVDWNWIDGEIAPLYSENGRPGIATRFVIGLLLLKHIYGLSDEGVRALAPRPVFSVLHRSSDAASVILSAVGHNFRRILAWLRTLWRLFLTTIIAALSDQSPLKSFLTGD